MDQSQRLLCCCCQTFDATTITESQYFYSILLAAFDLRSIFSLSATRVNTVGSEFRTILTRIREVKETLEETDNVEVARQLREVNDSLRMLEGNQSEFADAVFKVLENIRNFV